MLIFLLWRWNRTTARDNITEMTTLFTVKIPHTIPSTDCIQNTTIYDNAIFLQPKRYWTAFWISRCKVCSLWSDKASMLTHTYSHKPLGKISNHQFNGPFHLWSDVWSCELQSKRKGMVMHDTECLYWDQMSLHNTKIKQISKQSFLNSLSLFNYQAVVLLPCALGKSNSIQVNRIWH